LKEFIATGGKPSTDRRTGIDEDTKTPLFSEMTVMSELLAIAFARDIEREMKSTDFYEPADSNRR
jgi:hypothetical protein